MRQGVTWTCRARPPVGLGCSNTKAAELDLGGGDVPARLHAALRQHWLDKWADQLEQAEAQLECPRPLEDVKKVTKPFPGKTMSLGSSSA